VIVRAGEDQFYLAQLQPDGALLLERAVAGASTLEPLAAGRIEGFDPAAWHTLTVAVGSDQITASVDGAIVARAKDASLAEGNAGLWADGPAEFDDSRWRKFAPQEPTISIGPREDRTDTQSAWFSMARAAPVLAPAPAQTTAQSAQPKTNSPLLAAMAAMAALTTLIALGIMAVGLARNRIRG
jgi:hypothetical protein